MTTIDMAGPDRFDENIRLSSAAPEFRISTVERLRLISARPSPGCISMGFVDKRVSTRFNVHLVSFIYLQ